MTIAASASQVNAFCSGGASHPSEPAASHAARRPRTRMISARTGMGGASPAVSIGRMSQS